MGNRNSSDAYELKEKPFVKMEVNKSSSEEFPEEYAVIYTSLKEDRFRCVLRVRANRDKAQFTLQDGLCLHEEVSMNVEVNALRHECGLYILEIQKVDCNKDMKERWHRRLWHRWQDQELEYSYKDRKVTINLYRSIETSSVPCNLLSCFECLLVTMEGPIFGRQLYIDRMVEDNPEDCSNSSIIKTKYKFHPNEGKDIVVAASYLSTTGAINTVNSETNGKFNNSIFTDCHFHG
ncbi:hypothetical protein L6164_003494 [Bauhinia variegata]|uniref:Uncharacterized protein n=1 Tax=Bauhinia variegata TaxID=167791 RepID=A0ACB9Q3Q8_BAUVA|nr:hypothetical protein L6164_003494 [Bauhinia variegata]